MAVGSNAIVEAGVVEEFAYGGIADLIGDVQFLQFLEKWLRRIGGDDEVLFVLVDENVGVARYGLVGDTLRAKGENVVRKIA